MPYKTSEKGRARSRAYYYAHREERRAYQAAHSAAYREAHRETIRKASNEHYQKNRDKIRAYHASPKRKAHRKNYLLLKTYGISKPEFDAMLMNQRGGCAICGTKDFKGPGHSPVVDHDHTTGQVRGILCANCNAMLGWSKELIPTLKAAIEYLRRANTWWESDLPEGLRKASREQQEHDNACARN